VACSLDKSEGIRRMSAKIGELDEKPFGTIESTYEYMRLLGEALNDAKASVSEDLAASETTSANRRQDALRLIHFKLTQLESHVTASRRILNDLRTLRNMLLGERSSAVAR